jgi:hypothetical protein
MSPDALAVRPQERDLLGRGHYPGSVQSITYTISYASAAAASTAAAKLKALGLAVEPDINDPERELRVTLDNVPENADAAFEWLDAHLTRIGGDVLTWQVSRLDRVWSGPRTAG